MTPGDEKALHLIGFDADDTLWQNEVYFHKAEALFFELMADYAPKAEIADALLAAERRNIGLYGYGVKGFILSMIETAIAQSKGAVKASSIAELIEAGRKILAHQVEVFPEAPDVLAALAGRFTLVLITKGDPMHQGRKIEQSGLASFFDGIEIVSEKDASTYKNIFQKYGQSPQDALMLGNSLRSDVVAPISAGAYGVFVPRGPLWALETAPEPLGHPRYHRVESLTEIPSLIERVNAASKPSEN